MQICICPNYDRAEPDFFVNVEAGPTLFNEEAPGDDPITVGFIPLMLAYGGVSFSYVGQIKNRRLIVTVPYLPRERP
jgi:hypothetical protein